VLKNKVVVVARVYDILAAYALKSGVAKFLGYVGENGPSKGKLKHATPIKLSKLTPLIQGKVFTV